LPEFGVDRSSEAPLAILYRDEHIVVIDKPPNLLVHRSEIDRHETRFAIQILRDQIGQRVWPAHRLDRGTSGVLLFALRAELAGVLGRQFEAGTVEKCYWAVVRGHPPAEGIIDHPLSRQRDAYEFQGDRSSQEAQAAVTRFRRLATAELPVMVDRYPSSRYALIELEPVTGRRHQLRRHLKHIAHPIIGDATHGKGPLNRSVAGLLGVQRLWLHALRLQTRHPVTGDPLDIEAAPGSDWSCWPGVSGDGNAHPRSPA